MTCQITGKAVNLVLLAALAIGLLSGDAARVAYAATTSGAAASCRVWTTAEMVRILGDTPPQDALAVRISAARNEWESFQILLRSQEPISGIGVEAGDLVGPAAAVIPAAEARLYRQHLVEVRNSSAGRGRTWAFRPGWYADGLIPFEHPLTRRSLPPARYAAVPFDLPAEQTHGFWIDVYVPADARPGTYRGTYTVTYEGAALARIPVSLTVWDFELPRFASLRTEFGPTMIQLQRDYPRIAGKPSASIGWPAVREQVRDLLKRHRINPQVPKELSRLPLGDGNGVRFSRRQIDALREFIDRYNVNAVRVANLVPHASVEKMVLTASREAALRARLAAYDEAYRQLNRPQVVFYAYFMDEPGSRATYRFVQSWGKAFKSSGSVVKVLVTEQPTPQDPAWGDLYGAVDIWCPLFTRFRPGVVASRQAFGETFWAYTALNWWQIDYPPIYFRAPAWVAWHYQVRGLLYWEMAHWPEVNDPWTEAVTFTNRISGGQYNGEGSLLYPGHAVGFDGAVPSIRLKAIRDSIEDYEYLAILERQGRRRQAEQITGQLIGQFSGKFGPFMKRYRDGRAHEQARLVLAELIVDKGKR